MVYYHFYVGPMLSTHLIEDTPCTSSSIPRWKPL